MADEGDAAVWQHAARRGLRDVVGERAEAKRLGAGELVSERLPEERLDPGAELPAEDDRRVALDLQLLAQHLERVTVHVEVVELALLHTVQRGELGEHGGDQAEPIGERQPLENAVGDHEPAELGEYALRGRLGDRVRRLEREPLGVGVRGEAELGGEAREPQRAKRVGLVRAGENAQDLRVDVLDPAVRVDWLAARERHGDRVRGEVAVREVLLDRRALERGHVAREAVVPCDDPPRAELLGELERRGFEARCDALRNRRWVTVDG